MSNKPALGVIGGSGLYAMEGLEDVQKRELTTPFGEPSSPLILGVLNGKQMAFLARHGEGHVLAPSEVNYRANIYALKSLGVERVVSVSACGSLREDYEPGDIVVPDQIFDRTYGRSNTFFERGFVAHVSVADPFCSDLSDRIVESVEDGGGTVHNGGAYVIIPGPRFSTRVESNTYRAWGMSIVGMTTAPEAFLAREAEMCYAVMAHVTDYDVWHSAEEPVTVEMVFRTIKANTQLAQQTITKLVEKIPEERSCACGEALKDSLTTDPAHIPADTRERLAVFVDRYLE
jgi:5'-methylthioadenosine phosphorylase